jgi:hypothetical protein
MKIEKNRVIYIKKIIIQIGVLPTPERVRVRVFKKG